jgi:hypothetical protein
LDKPVNRSMSVVDTAQLPQNTQKQQKPPAANSRGRFTRAAWHVLRQTHLLTDACLKP